MLFLGVFFASFLLTEGSVSEIEGSGVEEKFVVDDWLVEGSGFDNFTENISDDDLLTSANSLCEGSVISLKMRNLILTTHNQLRSLLAFGKQRNKRGLMQKGRNIYKLNWNCGLEERIRRHIAYCNSSYMASEHLRSASQLYKTYWLRWDGDDHIKNIITTLKRWWSQGQLMGNNDPKNRYYNSKNYFAWANMAKGRTTSIGCSYQICAKEQKATFSCLYDQKAQSEKEMIYEPGRPCRSDVDCFTYPHSKCLVSEGLCQAPHIVFDSTENRICEENSKMTDKARITALEQHNFYRSRLARGLELNGETNMTQAKAKRMIKMIYDCKLEVYAQEWADNCVFGHSEHWKRPNQGQNLYMTSFRHYEASTLLRISIEKWWQELEEFGIPPNNVLSYELWATKGKKVGHWTQMAWDRTFRLGCAVTNCPTMGFVVCHYGPAGNRKNRKIYEMGEPCRTDSECGSEFTCIKEEGLCAIKRRRELLQDVAL